jgi:hypothetical protein
MWFRKRRARRVAEVRRQLSELGTEAAPPPRELPQPMQHFECGGRAHLVGTGSWLVAVHLRATLDRSRIGQPQEKRAALTRSDYLFAPFLRGKSSRKAHR